MPCTTILVGKKASYDGSTLIARNDDSGGRYCPKKLVVVHPEDQPRVYISHESHVKIDLPANPMRYTAVPNGVAGEGIWAAAGINAANVAMTATETITSNARVLGADPLVEYEPSKATAKAGGSSYKADHSVDVSVQNAGEAGNGNGTAGGSTTGIGAEKPYCETVDADSPFAETEKIDEYVRKAPEEDKRGGIGEEDIVLITLPYIHSAREGVQRLGSLLEQYGTYEMNGIAFSDKDEIWWLETIGGHHWIARRVPDDCYVAMPNQLGLDEFDLADALGEQKSFMCSADMQEFIQKNHLDLHAGSDSNPGVINARLAFGSHSDDDHVYNTSRAWYIERYLNPRSVKWDGADADFTPESDDIPWCRMPERKVTVEDIKYLLGSHYQGTKYDPYQTYGDTSESGRYRPIGVSATDFMALLQIRGYMPDELAAVEWICMSSGTFNAAVPFYTNVEKMPAYMSQITARVSTDSAYWSARLISALSGSTYDARRAITEGYQETVAAKAHQILNETEDVYRDSMGADEREAFLEEANQKMSDMYQAETDKTMVKMLNEASNAMTNHYSRFKK